MESRNNELFLIGDVARMFHISVGILRYYDKTGLLHPEYTDPETGYRYYSTRQFECLNTIRYLRALDMPLEEIGDFLGNRDTGKIREMLLKQKESLRQRQEELRIIERKIDNRLAQITDALHSEFNQIRLAEKPARRIAFMKKKLKPENYLDLEQSIRLLDQSEKDSVIFLGKVGVGIVAENLQKRQFDQYDMVFVLLDEEDSFRGNTTILPEETCVTVRFQGEHRQAASYYELLLDYIKQNQLFITGFSREITMIDYGLTNDTSQFVTEIQIPVLLNAPDPRISLAAPAPDLPQPDDPVADL